MRHKPRIAILVAASLLHGACSAEKPTGNSATVSQRDKVSARLGNSSSEPELDTRTGLGMTEKRIVISSDWGQVTAELVDKDATRALVQMLPVTIEMRDHLRQEKTGKLPSPLPEQQRQTEFSVGTLGLWENDDFVIYYRKGIVPRPGIIVLGRVTGDVSIDRPGSITVRLERRD